MNGLTMVVHDGMFIIGKMDFPNLLEPRIYAIVQVSKDQFQHRLNPLPASPAFLVLPKENLYYPVLDREITNLYVKATTRLELVN